MKAIAIVALIFSCAAMVMPAGGAFLAVLISGLAFVSFRDEPTIAGTAFGVNIINTLSLNPDFVAFFVGMGERFVAAGNPQSVYLSMIALQVLLLSLAICFKLIKDRI
jgi:hypothetical protein